MPLHSRKKLGIIVTPGAMSRKPQIQLSLYKVYKEAQEEIEEAQAPETNKSRDPDLWLGDPDPEHDVELVKVAAVNGWGKGNKVRSTQAVGRHAGRMNRRGVYPDTQKELGMGDGNERSDEQKD